jgi:hypothetical protein
MKRLIFCEGPDDLNALRAIAQHLKWASAPSAKAAPGAGQERSVRLQADDAQIDVRVPSKTGGATGEGKSALARMVASELHILPPQVGPQDESSVALIGVVFDPDEETVASFHAEVEKAVRAHASKWTLTGAGSPGVWSARREAGEVVEIRAVDWRAPGGVVDGLPDHMNLERLLCAVLALAYPSDLALIERWLAEVGEARKAAGRKPTGWKAAIHVWLAAVYQNADDLNAASRFLHQQSECKPHIEAILRETGLLDDLRYLLGTP